MIRPAAPPGLRGPRSFALPEFDPFWELVQESGIVTGMHASDSGYTRYTNEWEQLTERLTERNRVCVAGLGSGPRQQRPARCVDANRDVWCHWLSDDNHLMDTG